MSGVYRDHAPVRATDPETGDRRPPAASPPVPLIVLEPEGSARGGIVVLHEARELADALLEFMKSLTGDGWIVVAPDLFHRGATTGDKVFGADLFVDFDASFDWLIRRGVFPDCVGVLGFDSAGTAALLVATDRPIGAAVSVAAPGIAEPLTDQATALIHAAPRLQAPWLGLYGAADSATPLEEVECLRDAAARAPVATLVVTYPGLHHRADEPGLDAHADNEHTAVDARTRIFDWFDSHLR
ncbi:dienelactone hydrolase family protein [Nocardia sp. CDC159]|uniref:Dienelactone hydrolase family protein n=1 Tax=Nocardia pulmonis TaxID=2951408 RepID=A0A9X2ECV7_9NOCA|nr:MULTISPECIES: dienelactone hydrolase family protein [Nocardia]MCM6778514.1 dienelactone hydrolase family protein [Nocardia pulmonis]MCM6791403.1 dienelactone hydrolase family protein [Nocardia sp. CDC159]